jgi:hypothetical protein
MLLLLLLLLFRLLLLLVADAGCWLLLLLLLLDSFKSIDRHERGLIFLDYSIQKVSTKSSSSKTCVWCGRSFRRDSNPEFCRLSKHNSTVRYLLFVEPSVSAGQCVSDKGIWPVNRQRSTTGIRSKPTSGEYYAIGDALTKTH